MNILKLVSGTDWGAQRDTMLVLYRALVRPVLEYGLEAYYFAPQSQLKKLDKMQNTALRICCGAMRTSPVLSLQAAWREMPIDLKHLFLCYKYKCRLMENQNNPWKEYILTHSWHEEWPRCSNYNSFYGLTNSNIFDTITIATRDRMETIAPPWRISPPQIDRQLVKAIPSENPTVISATTIEYINRTYAQFLKIL